MHSLIEHHIRLFNTYSRQIEEITPLEGRRIRLYTCGPTIYDFAHIGNFRTYVFEDLLRRSLRFFGYAVEQVMNITDVDDKTIRGAIQKGVSLSDFTRPFQDAFFEDLQTLSIERAEHYPAATDYITDMVKFIEKLIASGHAYQSSDQSIYFKIKSFPTYGKLSHLTLDELKFNASGENFADEYDKEHLSDFVLWKAYDPERDGPIYWESSLGRGRPGWHIECSTMALQLLGDTIDIHCGGVDNIFPHHENEIAQSESLTQKRFVRYWVHVEHLIVDNRKMSKSLNNFYTLRDLVHLGYTGRQVRYLLISAHYRSQLNFTMQGLDAAKAALQRIDDCLIRLKELTRDQSSTIDSLLLSAKDLFFKAIRDDMNISLALSALFDFVRAINVEIDANRLGQSDAEKAIQLFYEWDTILGILPPLNNLEIPASVIELCKQREEARHLKNYSLSDQIRQKIEAMGYLLEDTPKGARIKKQ